MTNNDILRRLRYALSLNDTKLKKIFSLGGHDPTSEDLKAYMGRDDEPHSVSLSDPLLGLFLDGLILTFRGPKDSSKGQRPPEEELTNNAILKKLRIALSFQEADMLAVLDAGGSQLSKSELTALFRKPNHKHYRPCGNQILRNFLKGLTTRLRG